MPWLSADLAEKFYASNQDINTFLKTIHHLKTKV